MKPSIRRWSLGLVVAALLLAFSTGAQQLNSNVQTVSLSMSVAESLTITASPSSITFTPNAGYTAATASGPITISTVGQLAATRSSLWIDAYFASATSALANGSSLIPASQVFASWNGMTTIPCSGNDTGLGVTGSACNGGGGTFPLFTPTSTPPLTLPSFTNTSTLLLSLGGMSGLVPGSYTGVINIEAAVL